MHVPCEMFAGIVIGWIWLH